MSKKNKIILISIVAVAIIIVAILIWFNAKSANVNTKSAEEVAGEIASPFSKGEEGGFDVENNKTPLAPPLERGELSPEEIEEENLKSLAASFVERWGSWSTDGDFSNFESLKAQMTEEMKKFTDGEVRKLKSGDKTPLPPFGKGGESVSPFGKGGESVSPFLKGDKGGFNSFYGITTKALSANVKSRDAINRVSTTVIVQKTINENGTVSVAYDEVELEMAKEEGRWVVSKIH